MNQILIILLSVLMSVTAFAHGDHDSADAKPQKGGVLKSLETIHVELVQINKELRVYIISKDLKVQDPGQYKIEAKVVLPRGKGEKAVVLKNNKTYLSTVFDAKGLHRYDFVMMIHQDGHDDEIKFTIEPKKQNNL